MALFEVVVTEEPTDAERDKGELERLVLGPKLVVAKNAQAASFDIFVECQNDVDRSRMKINIRPF